MNEYRIERGGLKELPFSGQNNHNPAHLVSPRARRGGYGGKSWAAIVKPQDGAPGGLGRVFLRRLQNPNQGHYAISDEVIPGTVLEFADASQGRLYTVVTYVDPNVMKVEEFVTHAQAAKFVEKLRAAGELADKDRLDLNDQERVTLMNQLLVEREELLKKLTFVNRRLNELQGGSNVPTSEANENVL